MCCIAMMGRQIAKMFSTFSLWGPQFLMVEVHAFGNHVRELVNRETFFHMTMMNFSWAMLINLYQLQSWLMSEFWLAIIFMLNTTQVMPQKVGWAGCNWVSNIYHVYSVKLFTTHSKHIFKVDLHLTSFKGCSWVLYWQAINGCYHGVTEWDQSHLDIKSWCVRLCIKFQGRDPTLWEENPGSASFNAFSAEPFLQD